MRDLSKNKTNLDIYFAIGIIILCIVPITLQIHQEQKIIISNSPTYEVASICYPYNQTTNIPETLTALNPNLDSGIVYALSSITGNVNGYSSNFNAIFCDKFLNLLNNNSNFNNSGNLKWNNTWGVTLLAGGIPKQSNEILIQYKWWQQLAAKEILPDNLSTIQNQSKLWNLKMDLDWDAGNKTYSSVYHVVGIVKIENFSIMSEFLSYNVIRDYINNQGFSYGSYFYRNFNENASFFFGTPELASTIDSIMFSNLSVENNDYPSLATNLPKVISFISYFPHPTTLSLKEYWNIYEKINSLVIITNPSLAFQFKSNTLYHFFLSESQQIQEFGNDWMSLDFIYLPLLGAFLLIWSRIRWNQLYGSIYSLLNLGEDPGKLFRDQSKRLIFSQLLPFGLSLILFWLLLNYLNVLPIIADFSFNIYLVRIIFLTLFMLGTVIVVGFNIYNKISKQQTEQDLSYKQLLMSQKRSFTKNFIIWYKKKNLKQNDELSQMEKSVQNHINIVHKQRKKERWSNIGFVFIVIISIVTITTPFLLKFNLEKPFLSYWIGLVEIPLLLFFIIITPILIIRKWGSKLVMKSLIVWNKRTNLSRSSKQVYKKIFQEVVVSNRSLLILIAFGMIGFIFCSGWMYSLQWIHFGFTSSVSVLSFVSQNQSYIFQNIIISGIFTIGIIFALHKYLAGKLSSEKKRLIFLGETEDSVKKTILNYEIVLFVCIFALYTAFSLIFVYLMYQYFTLNIMLQIQLSNQGGLIGLLLTEIPNFFNAPPKLILSDVSFVQIDSLYLIFIIILIIGLLILLLFAFRVKTQEKSNLKLENFKMVD